MKINRLSFNILVVSGNRREITNAFMRFQEFYENPKYKDVKGFTVQDINEWWNEKNPEESYEEFWDGFNIPGDVILNVCRFPGFQPLTHDEILLLSLLDNTCVDNLYNSVIMGIIDGVDNVYEHELAHALYATDEEYFLSQQQNLFESNGHPSIKKFRNCLLKMGYHEDVIEDEIQAYLSTYPHTLTTEFPEAFNEDDVLYLTPQFVEVFKLFKANLLG